MEALSTDWKEVREASLTAGMATQDAFLELVLDQALERARMESGALHLLDRDQTQLVPHVSRFPVGPDLSVTLTFHRGMWDRFISDHELLQVHDDEPEWREWLAKSNWRSACLLPMRSRGRTVGIMSLGSSSGRRQLSDEQIRELRELASRAAMAVVYEAVVRASASELPDLINNLGVFTPSHVLENLLDFLLGAALMDSHADVATFILYDNETQLPCGALVKAVRTEAGRLLKGELRERLVEVIETKGAIANGHDLFVGLPVRYQTTLDVSGTTLGRLALFKHSGIRSTPDLQGRLATIASQAARLIENTWRLRTVDEVIFTDPLTGLYTRRYWRQRVDQELDRCRRRKHPLSVLFLDVDFFKRVNDTHGHMAGDRVLCVISDILRKSLRKHDVIARYGGEEFVALLSHANGVNALLVANRLLTKISNEKIELEDGITLHVTASGGLTTTEDGSGNADDLIRQADAALYAAKRSGRNQICTDTQGSPAPESEPERTPQEFGKALRAVIARVCHEVNNPTTVILGTAELLLEAQGQVLNEGARKSLITIIESASRIGEITKRIASTEEFIIREEAGIPVIELPPLPPEAGPEAVEDKPDLPA